MKLIAGTVLGAVIAVAAFTLPLPWFIVVVLALLCGVFACVVLALNSAVNNLQSIANELAQMPPEVCGFCGNVPDEPDRLILDVLVADETVHVPVHLSCAQEKIPHVVQGET